MKINSASGVIVRFPQSRSNPESNLVLGPGWGRVGKPPVWDVFPAATCRLSFIYKRKKKKSVTKSRACPLRCFHPSEKGQMCPLSGPWQLRPGQCRASAPGEWWSQWGNNSSEPGCLSGLGYEIKCCDLSRAELQLCFPIRAHHRCLCWDCSQTLGKLRLVWC